MGDLKKRFFLWWKRAMDDAYNYNERHEGEEPPAFDNRSAGTEYITVQKTPNGALVSLFYWSGQKNTGAYHNQWETISRIVPAGESVEKTITILRVEMSLKCRE